MALPPQTVLMIRHGEKSTRAAGGIDETGASDPDGLTIVGWQRSGPLAALFAPNDTTLRSTLPVPGALICPHYGDEAKHRPYLTLLGVAGRLGLQPHHHLPVDTKPQKVVDELAFGVAVVLLCWEHGHLPDIARVLPGINVSEVPAWPADRFDVVWRFDQATDTRYTFSQVPQQLLGGDRPTVISLDGH
jgi:hypothetical protein